MDKKSKAKNDVFSKVIFVIGIIVLVTSVVYFGITSKPAEMGLGLAAGAIIMAFGNLDKLKSFSGAGFSVELSERVKEAEINIDTLEELVNILFVTTVTNMAWLNRWGHPNHTDTTKSRDEMIKFMHKHNITNPEIDKAISIFNKHILNDLFSRLRESVVKLQINSTFTDSQKNECLQFLDNDKSDKYALNIELFRKTYLHILNENTDLKELVDDFDYFRKSNMVRRPDWKPE
ncbi:MAG: hypothetical protein Q7U04_13730 [Bacteriovorax sp.]|nr:hypothetical protein [Bacteriovorax sp.]